MLWTDRRTTFAPCDVQAHYRSLMELSEETMAGASGGVERIDAFFRRMDAAQITVEC
ncbi:MAG: hypothetical protein Ct9H90mP5_00110 [Acidimicrobiaceae bacterium]|nr:MAG: hypothetical protein Ct9H90mP5_00110 [Acidimicrobiaceae bacterium]